MVEAAKETRTRAGEVPGETVIADEVLAAIAGIAVKEVPGVSSLGTSSIRSTLAESVGGRPRHARGVAVEAGKKEAVLDLQVTVVYGYSIPKMAVEIRNRIADKLLELAGLVAKEINIQVVAIEFEEKKESRVQ